MSTFINPRGKKICDQEFTSLMFLISLQVYSNGQLRGITQNDDNITII